MAQESPLEREFAVRLAAMNWLASHGEGATFRQADLLHFRYQDQKFRLLDAQRGIRKPAEFEAALSMRTVYTPPGDVPPYEDQEGPDGMPRYKWRGLEPNHPENRALRRAMELGVPLIWFVGVGPGSYLPLYPTRLVAEEPRTQQFVVALDEVQWRLVADRADASDDARRYSQVITRQRLHQPLFRARVIAAYAERCAMCALGHVSLLDASHIIADGQARGQPVVPNGISLCKIHHAAYDQNIIGVSPDYRIGVRRDVLAEIDGPMLRHGLQALADARLTLPKDRASRPDRERLEVRYRAFTEAA